MIYKCTNIAVQLYIIYKILNVHILGAHLEFLTYREEGSKKLCRPLISRNSWLAPSVDSHGKFQTSSTGEEGKGNNYSKAPVI